MGVETSPTRVLRFGGFDLDQKSGELRKDGEVVKLPPQPFKVLALLARRGSEVVARNEIRQQIWSGETFVDFDQGLNFCIRQIREALGDDAEAPRYIETLPRRGYRFLMPIEVEPEEGPAAVTRLIVLPFRMLRPDPEMEFLVFSLPDAVTSSLSGLESIVVRSSIVASTFLPSLSMSAICPPISASTVPAAVATSRMTRTCRSALRLGASEASTRKACVSSASPASMATASPNAL